MNGLVVVVVGLGLLPFLGPGRLDILIGGHLVDEFEWAQGLLTWVRGHVET